MRTDRWCMQPKSEMFLRDVCNASRLIEQFIQGKSLADYESDPLLRAGVERQFIIIGEALIQASKLDPEVVKPVTGLRQIIGFRHVLVHAYAVIEDYIVWETATVELPTLISEVQALLATVPPP